MSGEISASSGSGGFSFGIVEQVAFYPGIRPLVSWPYQVGTLPRTADCFQPRAALDELRDAVRDGGTAVLCQVLAGAGGVGKTQLAAQYARESTAEVDLLVWVTASSRDSVIDRYAQAGVEILGADRASPQTAATAFLAWLEPRNQGLESGGCRWLVVLDDVTNSADLRDLWPPSSPLGRTLVTTRRRDAALGGDGRRRITVGLFTKDEAAGYLTTALAARLADNERRPPEPPDQIAGLAADLGYLPLALSQATAYLADSGLSCAAYRARLSSHATRLDDLVPEQEMLPDDQAATVAAAWSLSIERANRTRPAGLARPMLQLIAVLDPSGIPAPVLTSEPALTYLAAQRAWPGDRFEPSSVPPDEVASTLRVLHLLSLIDHSPGTPDRIVRIHQLIQRAVREGLSPAEQELAATAAADAIAAAWPDVERDTGLVQALRASVDALRRVGEDALWRPGAHRLLFRAGRSLGTSGQFTSATGYFERLADTARRRLGPDHQDTLAARQGHAEWRGEAGDERGAAAECDTLLADQERVLGADHLDTLATRNKMIYFRGLAGDPAGAVREFGLLLADRVRVLGPDHPDTLVTRHGLARFRGEAGDPDAAVADYEALLAARERVLGPDHPDTLLTQHGLAYWRGKAGDWAGAVAAFEALVARMLRVLGPDHHDTLGGRHVLADMRAEAEGAAAAITELRAVLADAERVLGPDHPEALAMRLSVARRLEEIDGAAAAAAEYERLVADRMRVLGPDHPDTLITRHCLASCRGRAGVPDTALADLEVLLADRVRVLGADHPDTLSTRFSIGYWLGETPRSAEAVDMYRVLLADEQRVFGPRSDQVREVRDALAQTRLEAGDLAGAVAEYRELSADLSQDPSADGRAVAQTRYDLAVALCLQGRQLVEAARAEHFSAERSGIVPENDTIPANGGPLAASWTEPVLACFTEALELTDGESEPGFYGVILHDVADTYRLADDLPTALTYYRQSAEYKERGGTPGDLATTRIALVDCLVEVGQCPEARIVLDQTTADLELIPDAERAFYLHEAGLSYEALGKHGMRDAYAAALTAYQKARALLDPAADPGGFARVLRDIGDVQVALGRLDEAEKSYGDAIEMTRNRPGTDRSLASMLVTLGRLRRQLLSTPGGQPVDSSRTSGTDGVIG